MTSFSISEAVKFGWVKVFPNLKLFIPIYIIYLLVQYIPNLIMGPLSKESGIIGAGVVFILSVVLAYVKLTMDLGIIQVGLNVVDGRSSKILDLFSKVSNFKLFIKYLLANILFAGIVVLGAILFIVPGIIFAIKLQFFTYLMIDKGLGPVEALRQSWNMTGGVKLKLFLLGIVLFLIIVLGFLALLVGLFVAVPLTLVAHSYIYRKLVSTASGEGGISGKKILLMGILGFVFIFILPIIVFVLINPIELTKRTRDINRLAVLTNLEVAINQAESQKGTSPNFYCNNLETPCIGISSVQSTRAIDGTGWVKVNLEEVANFTELPVDPVNSPTLTYTYCSDGNYWEITTTLESKQQIEKNNGSIYRVGTKLNLCQSFQTEPTNPQLTN